MTGIIPQEWKEAKVTPIFKSGEKDDVNNYHPISLLPLISKIMERTVQVQLVSFLTENNVLSEHQSGFRKRHSTQTAVTYLTDFDLVDHKCLLHKLEHYGVRGPSYNWFLNYLCTRSQRVKFGKELSSSLPLDYGVPQGSLLGPLLFVLYINDLPQCLLRSNIGMYADDTVIYTTGSESDCIMTEIQEDLQRVEQWMKNSKLVLNLTKTKCMLFGTKQKLANASFKTQLHGSEIERVRSFCYLGVTLDEHLSWKEHVSKVFTKVNKRLGLLGRIRSCLTLKAAKCVYNCLVLPVLCYTDTAWGELSVECKSRLQRLQNRAARIIVRRDSSSEALKTLGWPNLETMRKRNKSILVYKCLNNLAPQYLSDYFSRNHSFHSYNTRRREDIHPSRPKLSLGKRTFRYSGAILFNSLPETYKRTASLEAFKRLMMKHDFA